jgi:integrase
MGKILKEKKIQDKISGRTLHIFLREHSKYFHARTFIDGKRKQISTKNTTLNGAGQFAKEWFQDLISKKRLGIPIHGHTFNDAVQGLLNYKQNQQKLEGKSIYLWRDYKTKCDILSGFFKGTSLEEITPKKMEDYKQWRINQSGSSISGNTLNKDFITLRQLLKYAQRQEWIKHLPIFPEQRIQSEVRPWFPPDQWKLLLRASRKRIKETNHPKIKSDRQNLNDFMIFMVHSCLRVGECLSLRYRDVEAVRKKPSYKSFLRMRNINGKRGKGGSGTALFGAVNILGRLKKKNPNYSNDDLLFPKNHNRGFAELLNTTGLKIDKNSGRARNQKSLRTTGIMYRCMNNKNMDRDTLALHCRTSREMLERFYLKEISLRWTEEQFLAFDEDD